MNLTGSSRPFGEHRPDIEGLRAVAVIAVLLFHLQISSFSGGFIGVDVFFVISGFLIGGIVVREVTGGTFRLGDYLVRRVRRIVPVMLLVLGAITIAACVLLMPSELAGYAWSLGFSALFLANAHFWLHRGAYAESDHEVLLHMWTLGVEGQFYVLLPLIVLGLMRFGRKALWVGLVMLAALSAASSILYPSASFYMLPARLWEFLLGMMIAVTPLPFLRARWVREGLALFGIALIFYAALYFDAETPFPGWRAAIPCVGAGAIIAAGTGGSSLVGRVLETVPMRFIGKISYSLYLWHWPVIVLLLLGLPAAELDWPLKIIAAVLSFGLAVLSWRFVEEPFRKRGFPKRRLLIGSGAVTAMLVVLALGLAFTQGWPARFSERSQSIAAASDYPTGDVFRSGRCFIHHRSQSFDSEACLSGESEGEGPSVLLIGDSHAAHLAPGLRENFPGSRISQVTAAGCRPVFDQPPTSYAFCPEIMDLGWAYSQEQNVDLIVLAGRWEEGDLPALEETLRQLKQQGQDVLLIGPAAEWEQFVPRLLVIAEARNDPDVLTRMFSEGRLRVDAGTAAVAAETGTAYFRILTKQQRMPSMFDDAGLPLIVDNSHFTHEASRIFTSQIEHPALVRATD